MRLSIIMPAYNVAELIKDSMESVILTMDDEMELIVVDDCSTDDTLTIAAQVAAHYPYTQIKIYKLDENSGPARARNLGLEKSSKEWVYFMDPDDFLRSGSLYDIAKISDYIEGVKEYEDCSVIKWSYRHTNSDLYLNDMEKTPVRLEGIKKITPLQVFTENFETKLCTMPWLYFFKKSDIKEWFNDDTRKSDDAEFWIKWLDQLHNERKFIIEVGEYEDNINPYLYNCREGAITKVTEMSKEKFELYLSNEKMVESLFKTSSMYFLTSAMCEKHLVDEFFDKIFDHYKNDIKIIGEIDD